MSQTAEDEARIIAAEKIHQYDEIEQALRDYHFALDMRENGNMACARYVDQVQKILDMPWVQGAEMSRRQNRVEPAKPKFVRKDDTPEGEQ